jgi:hypothetical protein
MSSNTVISSAGRALTPGAVALMLMLCLSWGFNQIAVKLVLPEVPPMLQALTRSLGALPVLLVIGWFRSVKFFERDGTLWPGVCGRHLRHRIRADLSRPAADLGIARRGVSVHRAVLRSPRLPCLSRERLRASQWGGLGLSFAGVALAIGVPQANVDGRFCSATS